MGVRKLIPRLSLILLLGLSAAISLFLRVRLPYDRVFSSEGIKFTSADAYFHMRQVDSLARNFPNFTAVDPFLMYPGAANEVSIGFFGWLLAIPAVFFAWIIGSWPPSQQIVDTVGVYMPAVLGTLTIIPVYVIGKELFGRWAGVLSAGLVSILPGEFLGRSILGFADYHVAETLFTALTMMFLILAVKTGNMRQLTFGHLKTRDWATIRKPLIYSLLAAVFMGIYIFTWLGGLLFAFIVAVFFVVQFIVDHLKGKSTAYLTITSTVFFSVTLVISLLISSSSIYTASLAIALLIPPVMLGLRRLILHNEARSDEAAASRGAELAALGGVVLFFVALSILAINGSFVALLATALLMIPVLSVVYELVANKEIKPLYYIVALLGLGGGAVGLLYLVNPSLLGAMAGAFRIFAPEGAQLTTIEMQPLIRQFISSNFQESLGSAFALVWGNFNISFFLSFISLGILIYFAVKRSSPEKSLLVVWSLVILAATLGQRRFGYYFSINVALLSGYVMWLIIEQVSLRYLAALADEPARSPGSRRTQPKKRRFPVTVDHFITGVVSIIIGLIVFVVFAPNVLFPSSGADEAPAIGVAKGASYAPSDAWVSSLTWLKENSPEPFADPDAYYAVHRKPSPGETYQYPESAYGVLAWWDYGYWITRIAHRIPNANPSQDTTAITSIASFFTSPDEASANRIRQELDSAYLVIDHQTTLGKFWAIVTWAGKPPQQYFDTYFVQQEDQQYRTVVLYYPEYYRSMVVRLYNFDGEAVTPDSISVISYRETTDDTGRVYKIVDSGQQFATIEDAEAYLTSQDSNNFRIVGGNPLISPVPLEAVEHYQLVHGSNSTLSIQDVGEVPRVKIFEYID